VGWSASQIDIGILDVFGYPGLAGGFVASVLHEVVADVASDLAHE
jgi:hypothetical protein